MATFVALSAFTLMCLACKDDAALLCYDGMVVTNFILAAPIIWCIWNY